MEWATNPTTHEHHRWLEQSSLRRKYSIPGMTDSGRSIWEMCDRIAGRRIEFWSSLIDVEQSLKAGELSQECEFHYSRRTVALFGDDQFCQTGVFFRGFVDFLTVDEHDEVGILFDGSRLT